jgi:hypothetical protein
MKTIAAVTLLILLTAYLWLVVSLVLPPAQRPMVWTVAPATTAPLSEVVRAPKSNILDVSMFGCFGDFAVGEGSHG